MIHQRVDVEKWSQLFSVRKLREEVRSHALKLWPHLQGWPTAKAEREFRKHYPSVASVETPYHIGVIEQLRAEVFSTQRPSGRLVDILAFAKGEPVHRAVSKVGGLPYWPSNREWPVGKSGLPMSFVSQICFSDSMDIVGKLPGEILLIFADGIFGKDWTECDKHGLHFEWMRLERQSLIEATQMPSNRWKLHPWHASIHRTFDYVADADLKLEEFEHFYGILTISGSKIGGIPEWIQGEERLPGNFLCTIGTLMPIGKKPVPLLPYELPPEYYFDRVQDKDEGYFLVWGDMGTLYLSLNNDGVVHWTIQYS